MPNDFYAATGTPPQGSFGSSAALRAEFQALVAAFDKMPALGGAAGRPVIVNAGGTALEPSAVFMVTDNVATFASLPQCGALPDTDDQLVNKAYADSLLGGGAGFVSKSGDAMTGPLLSSGTGGTFRVLGTGNFLSFLDATEATRFGFLQGATTGVVLNADVGTLSLRVGLVEKLQLDPTQDGRAKFLAAAFTESDLVAFAASLTISVRDTNVFEVAPLTASVTALTLSNPAAGQTVQLRFKQDGVGGRACAIPAGSKVAGAIGTTANQVSILTLTYSARDSRWEGSWLSVPV